MPPPSLDDPRVRASLLALLAAAAILAGAADRGLWYDEIEGVRAAENWSSLRTDIETYGGRQAPYLTLLLVWLRAGAALGFEHRDGLARALSFPFALAAVAALYLLARRLIPEPAAILAAALLATNGLFVRYGLEARTYSLTVLLVIVSTLLLIRAVEGGSGRRWLAYGVVAALAFLSHYFALFALAAHAAWLLSLDRRRLESRPLALTAVGLSMVVGPVVWMVLTIGSDTQLDWGAPVDLAGMAAELAGGSGWLAAVLGGLVGLGIVSLLRELLPAGATLPPQRNPQRGLLLAWLIVPIGLLMAYTWLVRPVLISRYLLCTWLPAPLLVAALGALDLSRRIETPSRWRVRIAGLLIALLLAASVQGALRVRRSGEIENWRGAVRSLAGQLRPGDAITCFAYFACAALEYYLPPSHSSVPVRSITSGPARSGFPSPEPDTGAIDRLADEHPRVWLVLSHDRIDERRKRQRGVIFDALSERYTAGALERQKGVHLLLWARREPASEHRYSSASSRTRPATDSGSTG